MSYTGIVENGKVTLPAEAQLPNGTKVLIEPMEPAQTGPTLAESMEEFVGVFNDLPSDFAKNHDHYIHGTPPK